MQKTIYEDYKYCLQDTSRIYVGSKYTMEELLETEDVSFKFRMVMQKYVLPEASLEDTLETHLYYLPPNSLLIKLYRQMKARVKANVIVEKRHFGRVNKEYVTKQMNIEELTQMTKQEKEACGLVIQELSVSKLALIGL